MDSRGLLWLLERSLRRRAEDNLHVFVLPSARANAGQTPTLRAASGIWTVALVCSPSVGTAITKRTKLESCVKTSLAGLLPPATLIQLETTRNRRKRGHETPVELPSRSTLKKNTGRVPRPGAATTPVELPSRSTF